MVLEQPGSPKIVVERKKEQPKDGGFADETFTVLEPKQGPAKKWKASSALYSITGLRAAAFAAKPDAKAFDQARTVTLLGDGDKVLAKVRIGALTKDGNRRYVSSEGHPRVVRPDEREHGLPVLRRRVEHRHVADPGERHLERPRDRRGRHRQDVDLGPQLLQPLLVRHAETLLLVHDHHTQVLELDVLA